MWQPEPLVPKPSQDPGHVPLISLPQQQESPAPLMTDTTLRLLLTDDLCRSVCVMGSAFAPPFDFFRVCAFLGEVESAIRHLLLCE